MAGVKPIPEGYPQVTPYLVVDGAGAAIEFYGKVFGATERMRLPGPDGTIGHAELQLGDSLIMVADEAPQFGLRGPRCCGRSRTSSTGTGRGSSRTRSGIGGASPPTSRTSRRRRWAGGRPTWPTADHSGAPQPRSLSTWSLIRVLAVASLSGWARRNASVKPLACLNSILPGSGGS